MTNAALDEAIAQLRDELLGREFGSIRVRDLRRDEDTGSGSGDEDDDGLRLLVLLESPSDTATGAWPPEDAFELRRAIARWRTTRDETDIPGISVVLLPATPESQDFDPQAEGDLGQAVEGGEDERPDSA